LYNLEIAKIKNYPQSKNEGRVKKATIFAGKSFQRAKTRKEKKDIVSKIYFSLIKASALYCNLQDSKHISSKSSTLKLIYPQGTFFLYPCNDISTINNSFYVFHLTNQVDIENC